MKGSKILARIAAGLSVACFTGYLCGATHHLATAILMAIMAAVLYNFKPQPCQR